ncbi:MAG: MCE family protein [Fibrobacterales bacterium]|nr:MCE family protein [Fibrobacterales bacterium]MBP5350421.1 MCE family protein [Fibrobacterales bacterium]
MNRLSDKAIGYIAIGLVLLLCAFVGWKMYLEDSRGVQTVVVRFPDLGSLQPQDAVVERGVRVGFVRETRLRGREAEVEIDFGNPVRYCEGTRFINSNYSLMGQRYIVIMPVHRGKELDLSLPQPGEYEPGIAEAMHLVKDAVDLLDSLTLAARLIAGGDSAHKPFAERFDGLVDAVEGAVAAVDDAVRTKGPQVADALAQVGDLAEEATAQAEAVQAALDTSLVQARQALRALSEAAQAVRNAVAGADEGLDSLSKTEAWVRLAESRDLIDTLSAINGKLKRVVDAFNGSLEDGTNVGAWKLMKKTNWNVLGATAREKRAKREKEAGKTAEE